MDELTLRTILSIFQAQMTVHNSLLRSLVNRGLVTQEEVNQELKLSIDNLIEPDELTEFMLNELLDQAPSPDLRSLLRVIEGGKRTPQIDKYLKPFDEMPDKPDRD